MPPIGDQGQLRNEIQSKLRSPVASSEGSDGTLADFFFAVIEPRPGRNNVLTLGRSQWRLRHLAVWQRCAFGVGDSARKRPANTLPPRP
ncbi:similar to CysQ protein homolog [Rhodopirellula baltica SH 1]|uniref:Similar to CysQ protein homolog n=1 Tax=Rhodopirellula baltica (strain DSM 10527 / NCIMB 13988 / SH1) TaxID=243090 RepID=Q7UFM8_RHOBA|nr:similar to CysQ protein homolog [Rhodopirellula baltica SH 1]